MKEVIKEVEKQIASLELIEMFDMSCNDISNTELDKLKAVLVLLQGDK